MANMDKFILDGTQIDVEDNIARQSASAAEAQSNVNAQDIADLKALSRLTVAYDAQKTAIVFSTTTH